MAPAIAIFVFGVIYGSLAEPLMGTPLTVLSSLLIFSGSVQFTIAALLTAGAGVAAIIAGAAALHLRNVVLGAMLRPRVDRPPGVRGGLAWFLTDEAAGIAVASPTNTSVVLLVAGSMFYVAWQLGTALGVLGASVGELRHAAGAVFPVLFIGLAAATCSSWGNAARAVVAAVAAGLASWLWPGSQGVAAVVAALAVSIPERRG